MRHAPAELLLDARAFLGEGPAWDSAHGRLYWVDIFAGHLHTFEPNSRTDEIVNVGRWLGCAAPTRSGDVILGLRDGIAILELNSARLEYLASPEEHLPGNRFNDGKCAPDGRFLAGTMDNAELMSNGSLYSLGPGGKLKTLRGGIGISNGLAFSPDGHRLYFIDTPTRKVTAYDYDVSSGEISNPRIAISVPEELGWPDGMTSDVDGHLWMALWGGAGLAVWDPEKGTLLEKIELPAKNVTSCVFGGSELDELFITTARKGLESSELNAYPSSGGLFHLQTDVRGMPTFAFDDQA